MLSTDRLRSAEILQKARALARASEDARLKRGTKISAARCYLGMVRAFRILEQTSLPSMNAVAQNQWHDRRTKIEGVLARLACGKRDTGLSTLRVRFEEFDNVTHSKHALSCFVRNLATKFSKA
jgi:hypothetical protein